jgi:AmiR/NasT family two-component response regulator
LATDTLPSPASLASDAAQAASTVDRAAQLEELVVALAQDNVHLQRALDSRVVIEQAKGVLAERFGIALPDAFELLRRSARSNRIKLRDLAARVVESRETPAEIAALVERQA